MGAAPTARGLLTLWTRIGLKSFGGGQAVQLYAYDTLVEDRGWVSPEGWNEIWGMCQVVPGINVIAFAALSGYRLAGWGGLASSAGGLVVPSVIITIAVAAVFQQVQHQPFVHGALRGMVLASVGATFVMAWRLIRPALRAGRREARRSVVAAILLVLVGAALAATGRVPALAILLGSGAVMALTLFSLGFASAAAEDRP
ncbi:MAG: chromate transporter [Candidatus Dormibacteraeota bacterium]|nr:chromate transporter [Candidatus Dormibacteraeota bacterium]